MKRMKHPSQICKMHSFLPMEGYLYCQEKCKCARCLYRSLILVQALARIPSDRARPVFFSSQQGLWACHVSNIIAGITRRGDCWSWCLVNRSLQLSRCFTVIITTYQPLIATYKHLCACNTLTSTVSVASLYRQTACSTVTSHVPTTFQLCLLPCRAPRS